jgi:hypothetical protein
MVNAIQPGDVRVGHVIDDLENSGIVQAATMTLDKRRGAELTLAYLWESHADPEPRQFVKVNEWFHLNDERLPTTMLFVDERGWVTLTQTHISGRSIGTHPFGKIRAQLTIFGRPRSVKDEYRALEFMSTIDGLEEFARFEPIGYDMNEIRRGQNRITVEVNSDEVVEWTVGKFQYLVHSNVTWTGQRGRNFHVLDSQPFIQTSCDGGAGVHEHLEAQWPIRALLILVHGKKLAWRTHKLRDDEFPMWMLDGSDRGASSIEVQVASTFEQHGWPSLESNAFVFPMFRLSDVGADGMRKWGELYSSEDFRHAVEPAVEVINGASHFLEPQLMMLAISLDRFGHFRFADSKRRSLAQNIEKCLDDAKLDWPSIGSRVGIAKAIASVNNDLKHPDRRSYPDTNALAGLVRLATLIARAQVIDLLEIDSRILDELLAGNDTRQATQSFALAGLTIDDDGEFVRAASGGPSHDSGDL